jgi:hypothetical protein
MGLHAFFFVLINFWHVSHQGDAKWVQLSPHNPGFHRWIVMHYTARFFLRLSHEEYDAKAAIVCGKGASGEENNPGFGEALKIIEVLLDHGFFFRRRASGEHFWARGLYLI